MFKVPIYNQESIQNVLIFVKKSPKYIFSNNLGNRVSEKAITPGFSGSGKPGLETLMHNNAV